MKETPSLSPGRPKAWKSIIRSRSCPCKSPMILQGASTSTTIGCCEISLRAETASDTKMSSYSMPNKKTSRPSSFHFRSYWSLDSLAVLRDRIVAWVITLLACCCTDPKPERKSIGGALKRCSTSADLPAASFSFLTFTSSRVTVRSASLRRRGCRPVGEPSPLGVCSLWWRAFPTSTPQAVTVLTVFLRFFLGFLFAFGVESSHPASDGVATGVPSTEEKASFSVSFGEAPGESPSSSSDDDPDERLSRKLFSQPERRRWTTWPVISISQIVFAAGSNESYTRSTINFWFGFVGDSMLVVSWSASNVVEIVGLLSDTFA
mmetsp:Transcript_117416/g.216162  ORF Transcript_117416/g.216162 Transcript_117416/m.216162 type:complete len:320 (-) Transcript_117416:357-1316(-)